MDGHMSVEGEAVLTEVVISNSLQATLKHLTSLSGRDSPLALDAGNLSGDAIPQATAMCAKGKEPKEGHG